MPQCSVLVKLTVPQLVKKTLHMLWYLKVHYLTHKILTLVARYTPKYMHSLKKRELLSVNEGGTWVHTIVTTRI
jgi:hypothetical protein